MSALRLSGVAAISIGLSLAACVATAGDGVFVYGGETAGEPGWAISAETPDGWSSDCCERARATGVNLLMFEPPWTGRPDRVFPLNVWPKQRPTLDADWDADRASYLHDHEGIHELPLVIDNPHARCRSTAYASADERVDYVVFCDPGADHGFRYAWSTLVSDTDSRRAATVADFERVVEGTAYLRYENAIKAH